MELETILVIAMFTTFIALLFSGFPVGFVLGAVGVLFATIAYTGDILYEWETGIDVAFFSLSVDRIYGVMSNWILVALPMFIFMGMMLDQSGIAEKLMLSMQKLFGRVKGGLAITVTLIGIILAASTGIIGASVVLLGLLALPAMMKQNYSKELGVGVICAAGCLGILIPPSIMLVIMADQLAMSVGDLFMGAVLPGLLLGGLYVAYIFLVGLVRPKATPLSQDAAPVDWNVIWDVAKTALPPLLLIFMVLGSIFAGIATPTEASGIGVFGATILAWWNKKLNLEVLRGALYSTTKTTSFIFMIFIGATVFSLVLRGLGGDDVIEDFLTGLPFGPAGVVAFILVVVFLLGFFLDWIEISLIILPLVGPVVEDLGFNLVWFTVMVAVTLQTSFLTPPVGFALFYLKGVCPPSITIRHLYWGVVPFIIIQLIGLSLVAIFPELVTWLPSVAY